MEEHEPLLPKLGVVSVKWLRHTDGKCHGKDFFDRPENRECRGKLVAQAKQIALNGRVGRIPQNGRQLKGEFRDLTELKPGDFRFLGFRDGDVFYITNGARKDPKNQRRDYQRALGIRAGFFRAKPGIAVVGPSQTVSDPQKSSGRKRNK